MDRLWRSKTTLEPKKSIKPELLLPNAIGCKIIELEMEMDEGNFTKQSIIELLQQYTKAVQFYEQKEDDRHKLYQKKMQNFLQRPAVDAILKGGQGDSNIIMKRQKAQQEIRKATNINTNAVKKIMQNSEQGFEKQKKKIENQLTFQLQNLEKRLERKRTSSQRGAKVTSASFSVSTNTQDEEGFLKSFQEVKNPKHKVYM